MRWLGMAVAALGLLSSAPARAEKCPNMLILLDRSGSMQGVKWATAIDSINAFVPPRETVMRFGLSVFPAFSGGECSGGEAEVSCDFYNGDTIARVLAALGTPGGLTPTAVALDQVAALPELTDGSRRRFVVLLTDGDPTCPVSTDLEGNTVLTEASLTALHAAGVETFVIGFGQDVSPTRLDRMAEAGGVPRQGGTCADPANPSGPRIACKYYDASDRVSLSAAFDAIATVAQGELQGNSCDDSCYVIGGCPAGQRCEQHIEVFDQGKHSLNLGQCVADPCSGVSCQTGQYCREGACVGACSAPCPAGQYCSSGTCQPDPCVSSGRACVCSQSCNKFLICLDGTCQDDPCRYVTCPRAAPYCDRGGCYPASSSLVPADAGTADGGSGGGSGCAAAGPGSALPLGLALGLLPLLWVRARRRGAARGRRSA